MVSGEFCAVVPKIWTRSDDLRWSPMISLTPAFSYLTRASRTFLWPLLARPQRNIMKHLGIMMVTVWSHDGNCELDPSLMVHMSMIYNDLCSAMFSISIFVSLESLPNGSPKTSMGPGTWPDDPMTRWPGLFHRNGEEWLKDLHEMLHVWLVLWIPETIWKSETKQRIQLNPAGVGICWRNIRHHQTLCKGDVWDSHRSQLAQNTNVDSCRFIQLWCFMVFHGVSKAIQFHQF